MKDNKNKKSDEPDVKSESDETIQSDDALRSVDPNENQNDGPELRSSDTSENVNNTFEDSSLAPTIEFAPNDADENLTVENVPEDLAKESLGESAEDFAEAKTVEFDRDEKLNDDSEQTESNAPESEGDDENKTVVELGGNQTVGELGDPNKTTPEISSRTFEFDDEEELNSTTIEFEDVSDESDDPVEASSEGASSATDVTANDVSDENLTVEGLSDNTFEFDSGGTMEFAHDENTVGEAEDRNDDVIDSANPNSLAPDNLTGAGGDDEGFDEGDKTTPIEGKTTPHIADQTFEFNDESDVDQTFGELNDDETVEHESKSITAENVSDNTFEFGGEANQTFAFDDGEVLGDSGVIDPDENTVDLDDRARKTGSVEDGDATAEIGKTVPLSERKSRVDSDAAIEATINRQSDSKSISDARIKSMWKDHVDSDISPSMSIESMRLPKVAEDFSLNPRLVKRNQKALHTRRKLDYIVGRQLGAGGMGRVQMAHQVAVDRKVAFKEIQPKLIEQYEKNGERPQLESKFLAEAHLTASLDHPNIVSIYDLGIDQDNNVFYCMEIVDGKEWEDFFAEKSLDENIEILLKVADGIAYAHSKHIIHRDIKPENVMIGKYSQVLIMDWGLAVDLSKGKPQSLGGTPSYMAPEMVKGPRKSIGPRSDIYLLGAVLYHIAVGRSPRRAKRAAFCIQLASSNHIDEVTDESVDKGLLSIALKAMETNLDDRYQTVGEFQTAIRTHLSNKQSIVMAERAASQLDDAITTKNYETFSTSLFGYREANALWNENESAKAGEQNAKIAYAECAKSKGDYELGMSLLDENIDEDKELYSDLLRRKKQKERQVVLIRYLSYSATLLVIGFLAYFSITSATLSRKNTEIAKKKELADELNVKLGDEKQKLKEKNDEAERLNVNLKTEKKKVEAEKDKVVKEKQKVDGLNNQLVEEKNNLKIQTDKAIKSLYASNISLADNQIRDNRIGDAIATLNQARDSERSTEFIDWEYRRLRHLCHELDVQTQTVDSPLTSLKLDESKTFLISNDGAVSVWDLKSNKIVSQFQTSKQTTAAASNTKRNVLAIAAFGEKSLTLWDIASGKQVADLSDATLDSKAITSIAFDQSGSKILVGDSKGRIYGWNLDAKLKAAEPFTFAELHSKPIRKLAFSPNDQSFLSSAGTDGLCLLWNWRSKSVEHAYQHESELTDILFSNANQLLAASDEGEVIEIDFSKETRISDFENDSNYEDFLSTLPEDSTESAADKVIVFNDWPTYVKNPAILSKIKTACRKSSFVAHDSRINAIDLNGNQLLTVGEDQQVLVWDIETKLLSKRLRGHNDDVISAQFSEAGKLVSVGVNGQARYWDVANYEDERFVFPATQLDSKQPVDVKSVRTNRDGTKVVVADVTGRVFVRDNSTTGKIIELGFNESLGVDATFMKKSNRIVTSSVNLLKIWQAGSQYFETKEIGKAGLFTVSESERLLVTAGDESHPTLLWDIDRKKKVAEIFPASDGRHRVTAMAISPDDKYLAVGTGLVEGLLFIYDLNAKKLVGTYERHRGWISDIVFTDSNTLFTADALEGYVNVWTVSGKDTKFNVRIDEGLGSYIKIAATTSGDRLVTSSIRTEAPIDGTAPTPKSTLKVWDTKSLAFLDETELKSLLRFLNVHVGNEVVVQESNGVTKRMQLQSNGKFLNASAAKQTQTIRRPRRLNGWKSYENAELMFADGYVALVEKGKPVQSVGNMSVCTDACFVNDDKDVLALYELGLIRRWNLETATITNVIQSPSSRPFQMMSVSPSETKLAAYDGEYLSIFTESNMQLEKSIKLSGIVAFDWLDDESVLYSAGESIIKLDIGTAATNALLDLGQTCTDFEFTPDAKSIACILRGDDHSKVFVFKNVEDSWKKMGEIQGDFSTVAIANNGNRIFTGSQSGALTIWNAAWNDESDFEIRPLLSSTKHTQGISAIYLGKESQQLSTASENGEVIVWLAK